MSIDLVLDRFKENWRRNIVYIFFVSLLIFFSVTLGDRGFFSLQNLNNVIVQTTTISIMAVGMNFVFSAGMNDLSIGANLALSGLICAFLLDAGYGIFISLMAVLVVGAGIGIINGVLVTYGKLPPWLATVGTQIIIRGIAMFIMDTDYAVEIRNEFFLKIFGQGNILGIPVLFYWTLGVLVFGYIFMNKHRFGEKVLAVGGNEVSAKYCGINTVRVKIKCMLLCAILTSVAGVLYAARLSSARYTVGDGIETDVIAAVVLGGTSMTGGKANIFGALAGSLLIGVINSGLIIAGFTSSQQMIISGVIIVIALLLGEKS